MRGSYTEPTDTRSIIQAILEQNSWGVIRGDREKILDQIEFRMAKIVMEAREDERKQIEKSQPKTVKQKIQTELPF